MKPAVYLKDTERLRNLEYQMSHPNKKNEQANNQQQNQVQNEEVPGPTTAGTIVQTQPTQPVNTTPSLPTGPPEPRFNYMDISISNIANIAQHITINNSVNKNLFYH